MRVSNLFENRQGANKNLRMEKEQQYVLCKAVTKNEKDRRITASEQTNKNITEGE